MKLYNYYRSSAAFRVRIALEMKGLKYEYIAIHLAKGEQLKSEFGDILPDEIVPVLEIETDAGIQRLSQSMAIIEYLDETHPANPLLPADAVGRAQARALAQSVACEIHPLNNLRVLKYLVKVLGIEEEAKNVWVRHWIRRGLDAFERQLQALDKERATRGLSPSTYCLSSMPTLADLCLVPQIFNAKRFNVNLDGLPRTMAVFELCMAQVSFQKAQPSSCPDFEA
jgi:maleylacetoacetate isomerase